MIIMKHIRMINVLVLPLAELNYYTLLDIGLLQLTIQNKRLDKTLRTGSTELKVPTCWGKVTVKRVNCKRL